MNTLPKKWQEFLSKKPETGMGYQVVNLILEVGRRIDDVVIIQSALIGEIRNGDVPFDPEKITEIELTHKKWNFRRIPKTQMKDELTKADVNTVTSSKGFTVQVKPMGGILYRDAEGDKHISSEWLANPPGIILYKGARVTRGFDKMEQSRIDSIFFDVARALEHLGHRVEIWSSPSGPDKQQKA